MLKRERDTGKKYESGAQKAKKRRTIQELTDKERKSLDKFMQNLSSEQIFFEKDSKSNIDTSSDLHFEQEL